MIKIRYGCFETNSSSVHSLIIANDEEYKKLINHELYIRDGEFITKNEVIDEILFFIEKWPGSAEATISELMNIDIKDVTKENLAALPDDKFELLASDFADYAQTYDSYLANEYLETYEDSYVTEHGDKIHIFGVYGRDG